MELGLRFCLWACLWTALGSSVWAKRSSTSLIEPLEDPKEFKKLIRTKTNVLVAFLDRSPPTDWLKMLTQVAEAVKGVGTIATVNCGESSAKKLCKKLKISGRVLKHYQDGEFHLDYDRQERARSMVRFLKDPKGDLPWDEDDAAHDVVHIASAASFSKLLKKEKERGLLVMFYAPWCGYCKRMKPDYQEAATALEVSSEPALLVAVDVTVPENSAMRRDYEITGFPTLLYFPPDGAAHYPYPGDNKKQAILDFLANPSPEAPAKVQEAAWQDEPSEVVHLTDDSFDEFIAREPSVLIMFYAPWCGHCKRMKPQFTAAAAKLQETGLSGKLAAVDCTVERKLGSRFEVKGYPSVKYFKDGQLAFEAGHVREEKEIVKFMQEPSEPPPPPPPETPWSQEESEVHHLDVETFKPFLKKKKHVLVFFYAPWCGHCKRAKPEFTGAAVEFADNPKAEFVAVDCTEERSLCSNYEIKGYPTLKYFRYFDKEPVRDYESGRTQVDFVRFMRDPDDLSNGKPPPPPSPVEQWAEHAGAENVLLLGKDTFKTRLELIDHALVMFYAPWCGHCKSMKPDYAAAALGVRANAQLALAAVDTTVEPALAEQYGIKGYPTIKYFKNGIEGPEYTGGRRKSNFVDFLQKAALTKDEL